MHCRSCKGQVVPRPPKTAWKLVNVGFWIALLATGMLFGCLLGLNVVLVPVWCFMAGAVGVATHRASSWSCPKCNAELVPSAAVRDEVLAPRHHAPHTPLEPRHA